MAAPPDLFLVEAGPKPAPTPSRERAAEVIPPEARSLTSAVVVAERRSPSSSGGELTGVDQSAEMLTEFSRAAGAVGVGRWQSPDLAGRRRAACPSRPPTSSCATTSSTTLPTWCPSSPPDPCRQTACRRRAHRSSSVCRPHQIWRRDMGIDRPDGPMHAAAAGARSGIDVTTETSSCRPVPPAIGRRRRHVRRHLCVGPERDGEIDRLLPADFGTGRRPVTCLWWPGAAAG